MDISVLVEGEFTGKVDPDWLARLAEQALNLAGAQPNSEASVVITNQEKIRWLHKEYLDEDEPTDVLSFSLTEPAEDGFVVAPDGLVHLGEIIISYPQAEIQSREHGHAVEKEITILLIHGTLHLLGYDHDEPQSEAEMKAREAEILSWVEVQAA